MAVLLSVNVGTPQPLGPRNKPSGIFKLPQPGPVEIGPLGLTGDAVLDRKHHGGPDQAVYVYLQQDYDWWAGEGEVLAPGTFGENLTIAGIDSAHLSVGDRFRIGPVLLEVTSHRAPCNTLAMRMDDSRFVKRFVRARRPGAYCRVLELGAVAAGADVDYLPFAGETVTVADLLDSEGQRSIDEAFLRRALAAPLHLKLRAGFEERLRTAP